MLASISAEQWYEWLAYGDLEPFGGERDDARFASIVFTVRNAVRTAESPPVEWESCVLSGGDAIVRREVVPSVVTRQTWQAQLAIAKSLTEESRR